MTTSSSATAPATAALATYGRAIDGILSTPPALGSLLPQDLCAAYAAALDAVAPSSPPSAPSPKASAAGMGAAPAAGNADARTLLALVRSALGALSTFSRAGSAEATSLLSGALRMGGLYSLIFRDQRLARAAVEAHLCEDTTAAFERASERVVLTATRDAKAGEVVRTLFTLPDGRPLRSFVLFRTDDGPLVDSFVESFAEEPVPAAAFRIYAETRPPAEGAAAASGSTPASGDAATAAVALRARLGERVMAAASAAYVASLTVLIHNMSLGLAPAPQLARLRLRSTQVSLTPSEFEGLFLAFIGYNGAAALVITFAMGASGAFMETFIGLSGPARVLDALPGALSLSDTAAAVSCLNILTSLSSSERAIQALIEKDVFVLLRPAVLHENAVIAVRACFTVAVFATTGESVAEKLQRSGTLGAMLDVLHSFTPGNLVITGVPMLLLPFALKLLQPNVPPALQLAALHRLGAALTGTTAHLTTVSTAPMLAALRGCAASPDSNVGTAALYLLKELHQPLQVPVEEASAAELAATIERLKAAAIASEAARDALARQLRATEAAAEAARLELAEVTEGFDSVSVTGPDEREEATRSMLAELLGRGSIAPEPTWRAYMRMAISDNQLDALASIGVTDAYGSPLAAAPLPEKFRALFPPATRAALVRLGITL